MSHARTPRPFHLTFSDDGTVELTLDGKTMWASDADPDFVDEFGDDVFADDQADDDDQGGAADDELADDEADDPDELVNEVLDYLVERGQLSEADAERCQVWIPQETTE